MDNFAGSQANSSLPILKKIERAKLKDLYNSVEEEKHKITYNIQQKKKIDGINWEWQADDGTWQVFEPNEQARLEYAVESRQKTVPFVDSIHFMHTADLICMEMINMKTGKGKKIRRTPLLDSPGDTDNYHGSSGSSKYQRRSLNNGWNFDSDDDDDDDEFDSCDWRGTVVKAQRRDDLYTNLSRISPREAYTRRDYSDDGINFLGSSGLLSRATAPRVSEWSRYGDKSSQARSRLHSWSKKKAKTTEIHTSSLKSVKLRSESVVKREENKKLQKWLEKVKLEEYFDKFKREKITLKEVHSLREDDLKSLGLPMGARKRFLENVAKLKTKTEPPNEYLCPITMTMMKDPVILSDGFSYERSAIEQWLEDHDKSPMTNQILASSKLTTNRQLKKLIEDFKACTINE